MIRNPIGLAVLLVAKLCTLARGQEFRVELFSKSLPASVTVQAGTDAVQVCDALRKLACLTLEPHATAQCKSILSILRCEAGKEAKEFRKATLASATAFRLAAGQTRSTAPDVLPPAALRRLDIQSTRIGMRLIATIDLETYVAGVLAGEAVTLKSPGALAAMAIVARTWALKSRGRHKTSGFDFCSLTHCQFFRPPLDSAGNTSVALGEAVAKSAGIVLKFHGQLIDAYYGANCGGTTEAAADVWPDRAAPYLQSVSDPYCAAGSQAAWQQMISPADLTTVLRGMPGVSVRGRITEITIENKDPSGRARTLRVGSSPSQRVDANAFRYAVNRRLGWNTLKSNLYTVERRGYAFVFTGRGLGHGVGFCQAGAEQMGRMGIPYEKILTHYFPGTAIGDSGTVGAGQILSSEHFEIVFPPRQGRLAARVLEVLESQRVEFADRASVLPTRIRLRTWDTTADFIRATRQRGWVAASNDGRVIDLQPLDLLTRKGILESTIRHELTHLVVRRRRAPEAPRWYEEGLVLYLTGEPVGEATYTLDPRRGLELSLSKPRSESEMRAAYALAFRRVKELARQRGKAALWQVLERPTSDDLKWFKGSR